MSVFDQDIAVTKQDESLFRGTVSPNWLINGNPNGGYLMALAASAMLQRSARKSIPIMTVNYIARCVPGDADLRVDVISESSQFSRIQARLLQEGSERIRAWGTFAEEKIECVLDRYETAAPELAPLESCVPVPAIPKYTLMENLDIRLDPSCAGWMQGKLTDKSEHKGWIRFRDGRPFDMLSLLLMADAFPPPIFASQGLAAWVPTLELSVSVRNIPQTKWLKGFFRTRFVSCGLVEEDGEMWDEDGNLAVISRQIAQYRSISKK
ncbi:MAG TPA: thioesterase family protein [Spirochaetota bacterium]|nr:thioesterase family protein [Spirochaetota bacterium]HPL15759.1 thioesterase family protein [Spirochaetota bacterium]HQF07818.1 thioesterase family protein [Spirochaetota bacterium]HQH96871.1 thioesterase family protein [Spirochaetota bacterium]HQJ70622.1 thioesterase family protein [Spirochaetota bacterium]